MNKLMDGLTGFITSLKTDKKKRFIVIGVVVALVLLIIIMCSGSKETVVPGFGTQLGNIINTENYNGSGTLSICNNEFDIVINKNNENAQMGISNDDVDYSGLITKYNSAVYLNYGAFENKGDIVSIRKATPTVSTEEDEEAVVETTLKSVLLDILNSQYLTFVEQENIYTATLINDENWKNFFDEAASKISENKESISSAYTDVSPVKAELETIGAALQRLASSTNDANSITLIISYNAETEEYTLSIDVTLDFDALPDFVQEKDFDTNKFTVYSTINYTFNENTVNIPSGSVRNISNETVNDFITDCWNSLFERKAYVTRSVVTEKADSVQCVINLGNTTETYQYLFDDDGVYQGTLLVKSKDENIIQQYITKYGSNSEQKVVFNSNTKDFSVTLDISDTGISSLNKISTTPKGLAAYLKTAEGVVPIV